MLDQNLVKGMFFCSVMCYATQRQFTDDHGLSCTKMLLTEVIWMVATEVNFLLVMNLYTFFFNFFLLVVTLGICD